ncbi:MAG: peptidoglycan-binding protein [Bryobacterales bacterium]|nr:peptidoglycan-binding protein [Bryobacterales bacterium]
MTPTLAKGASGQAVRALQDVLNFQVRRGAPLQVDGVFGAKTEARVREFQAAAKLQVDGIVGPLTNAQLFEVTDVTVPLIFMPRLQLTLPAIGQTSGQGIQPPRLVPPLQWPGPPFPAPPPFQFGGGFSFGPASAMTLPSFSAPADVLGLRFTVPTRKDTQDPAVASRTTILELIENLPTNSKFKALLVSQVPDPVQRISPPGTGFQWGLSPLFDPLDPKGFGVKGNARFSVRISEGLGGLPNVVFSAWGDGKLELDFTSRSGQARPHILGQGQLFLGFLGVF